jgi:hypothetical protein
MPAIRTNRDLYLAVAALNKRHEVPRPLEEYLRALHALALPLRARDALSPDEFFGLLTTSFTANAPAFEESWRGRYSDDLASPSGFEGWEAHILRQLVDLREMDESGRLTDKLRYLGIDSPRGSRWYNFDPCTFLECAVAGSYGGWEPGDDTGRDFVPGPVAALDPDGKLIDCDPRDLDRPVNALAEVTWDDFCDFLGSGQWYE